MHGPEPKGHWTGSGAPRGFAHLKPGNRFTVVTEFTDYDGARHSLGETWTFLSHSFLPYDDGMSFFVSFDGEREWHIRLQWRPEAQGAVLDLPEAFIRRA
jgi:hypothetical protein